MTKLTYQKDTALFCWAINYQNQCEFWWNEWVKTDQKNHYDEVVDILEYE